MDEMNISSLAKAANPISYPVERRRSESREQPAGSAAPPLPETTTDPSPDAASPAGEVQLNRENLEDLLKQMNEASADRGLGIRFRVSEEGGRIQVQLYDPNTQKVVRTYPPDKVVDLAVNFMGGGGVVDESG